MEHSVKKDTKNKSKRRKQNLYKNLSISDDDIKKGEVKYREYINNLQKKSKLQSFLERTKYLIKESADNNHSLAIISKALKNAYSVDISPTTIGKFCKENGIKIKSKNKKSIALNINQNQTNVIKQNPPNQQNTSAAPATNTSQNPSNNSSTQKSAVNKQAQ